MMIMPPTDNRTPDHSNTPAGATAIAVSESFQGRIDSPNDVDYFRLRVDSPGTLTIRTTGNGDPDIAVFDGAGNEVPGVRGSWIGGITQDILDRGSDVLVRFSGGNAGAEYTGNTTLDQTPQTSPDLTVVSPTVSNSSPAVGSQFTLWATVQNDGNGESAAATLRYYRSTDATITTSDTEVGTDAVAGLAPSGSDRQSVDMAAPSAPGTYYYGACVDAVAGESDTANNCSTSVQVTVREPDHPDLTVVSPSVSNSSPAVGSQFTLSATVQNDGNGESAGTTLRYFRSTDATITTSDTEVGTDAVAGLAPSGSDSQSVELAAPSAPGPYYYGACVDAVAGESNTANNCSTSVQVTVREPDHPDLTVVSPSVSNSSPAVGSQFTLSATVQNDGNGESAGTTLRYYRSTDATITTSDTEVGTDAVAGFGASGSDSQSVELVAPSTPGTYYYGACVDAGVGESDTANNCSPSVQVTVREPDHPDLTVVSPSVSDNSPAAGVSFTLSATVQNDGNGESAATTLRYFRSPDVTITTSDTEVGTDAVAGLARSGSDRQSVDVGAPSAPGPYYYGACVDAVAGESDTANNCSPSVQVTVLQTQQQLQSRPDLEVGTPTVSDDSPAPGASFTLSATVQNDGNGESAATTLRYFRSPDVTITTSDTEVGTDAVAGLARSGSDRQSVDVAAPSAPGPYYYGACVDVVAGESNTANNCSTSVQVTVLQTQQQLQSRPDLEVGTPTVSDDSPAPGASFTLSATVQNDGNGESAATTLRYFRSPDATITTSDTEVGTDAVAGLAPSGSDRQSVDVAAPSAPGPYYYGACVDVVAGESNTANNCSTSVQVTVLQTQQQLQSRPDLEVGTPTVSDDSPAPGASFTLSATVQNDGNGESAATTLRYFRSPDATITTSDTEVGTDAVAGLARSGSDRQSVDVAAPSAPGPYYYGACVDAVAGESDTANNCSPSVQVTVREPDHPELTVVSPSVSDNSPAAGVSFTLSATVQNDGNGESAATTLRYFRSTDATITTSDTEVGTDAVAGLAPSGSDSQSVELAAPSAPGPYYYGACVDAVAGESDTANNCSPSVQVTVREPDHPELTVVSPSVSNSSPAVGSQFTLSARVQNDGNGESAAATLRYYRSTDGTITTSDTEVGTDAVAGLAPSGSDRQSVDMAAPSAPGPYYYGACVDAVAGESDTANNCSPAVQVTVREPDHPDLTVVSPSVSDDSPAPGASFTLSATVQNDGNGESAATTLRYFRSTDATITTSDTEVGTDAVAGLAPSGSDSQSVELVAPSAPGTYHYGACVDAVAGESDAANNCSTAVQVTVREPAHPDLMVVSPSVSNNSPTVGSQFTLSATVQNDGNGESAATTLRYYRSPDATITTSDTEVGTDAVAGLAPSGSDRQSVDVAAPSAPGPYYYGACVDVVAGESNTANNCSTSVQVTVLQTQQQLQGRPDLEVGTPTVSDDSPAPGVSFTLSATVQNDGNGESAATTLRYFRSPDATITTSDTEVGTDAVAGLAPSGSDRQSADVAAPSAPGPYYYGACVDAVAGESNTANNCSTSVQVTVLQTQQQLQGRPDLEVGTPTVSDNSPAPGVSFTLSATVQNDGNGESAATTLRYFRSPDATITTSDTEVGTDAVAGLARSGSDRQSVDVAAPSAPGPYYYGACVDAVAGESNTANNCSTSVQVTVLQTQQQLQGRPDLEVGTPTVSDDSPAPGASFTLSATVQNDGNGESAATTLRYFRSPDATITTSDTEVGTDAVAGLAPSGSDSQSVELAAPSAPGPYYYGACVDAVAGESDTANNCSPSVQVTVREPDHPELTVVSPSVSNSSPAVGSQFTLSATVQNDGNGESAGTTLRYYRSTDATITTSDTEVGTDAVAGLAPSGSDRQSVDMAAPSAPGPYYYGACVDAVAGESDTANNCSPSVQVTVREPDHPDLTVVSPSVSNSSPAPGASFTLSATVQNDGNGESAGTTLHYYRSTDATITTSDAEVGTDAVAGLAPSGSDSQSVELVAPSAPGTYHYGACVDAVAGESDAANNCSTAVQVTVREPAHPDLMVVSPSVSNNSPTVGSQFTLSATVQNDGNGESAATTLRYFRSPDVTITTSDTEVGTDAVAGLARSGSDRQSVDVAAPSAPGPYYYGACVEAVAGESNTANNCSTSVQVTVLQTQQQLQGRPDLEVGTPTVSDDSPSPGASFALSATVQNDGNGESAGTTLRYYRSTDATITTSDTEVGTDAVGGLAASGGDRQSVELAAPSAPGPYYYGACVDAVAGESNTANNCSTSVQVTVLQTQQQLQGRPDLEVGTPTVSDDSPSPGASFALSATVQNDGNGESAGTTLRYYRSTDAAITTSDTEVGTDAVAGLAPSESDSQSVELAAPSAPGPYYYGACVDVVAGESNTANNCSTSVQVTVLQTQQQLQGRPDLEVGTPTVSDDSPAPGASFTLSATVQNDGNGESAGTTLRYYRSTDATITRSDTSVGMAAVGTLAAAGISSQSISVTAPSRPGTWYYGACVDAVAEESNTTKNCSSAVKVMVTPPDLEMGTPTVSDVNPASGGSFTLSATVSNTGSAATHFSYLRYYRSTDTTITTSDTPMGWDFVRALAAAGTTGGSISLTAPSIPGTYYYGACVDAVAGETNATNNCTVSVTVTVREPQRADLAMDAPTASDGPGAYFYFRVTVKNTGDMRAPSTTLRFYRSADPTITTSDTEVGTDAVAGLAASGSDTQSVELAAPSAPGTYHYGACVDAVVGESNTANNCSKSVQVRVREPDHPDLTVVSPSVSNSSPAVGSQFTLSATVQNDGNGESAATTLRYFRSTDATITTSDTPEGTAAVPALAAAGTSSQSVSVTAPSSPGTWYYGACVDEVADESVTTNNCSSSVEVTVLQTLQQQQVQPDLAVGSPTVSDDGPGPGASFTLSATVSNAGDGESPATTLRYYRSADATITTADTAVGTADVGVLSASVTSAVSILLTAPSSPGPYYYGACVDAVTDESNTANNCSSSVEVTVLQTLQQQQVQPDLAVGSPTVSDDGPGPGASFTLSATVSNAGDGESPATTLRYYRSADATITTADTAVGTADVGVLSASVTSTVSISLTAPSSPGPYYYGACVDEVTDESNTANNCSSSVEVTVLQTLQQVQQGLVVRTLGVSNHNPHPVFSNILWLTTRVTNTGDARSGAARLRFYRSRDATITTSDTFLRSASMGQLRTTPIPALGPWGFKDVGFWTSTPWTPGTYYYGACVDTELDGSDATDNCSSSVTVTVQTPEPTDLEMIGSPTASNSSPAAGATFSLSATVRNDGDLDSDIVHMVFYRSTDSVISTSDTEVGRAGVGPLGNGWGHTGSVSLHAPSTPGPYYYGACVWSRGESDYTNNCSSTSVRVDVMAAAQDAPDLVIPTLWFSHFNPGLRPQEKVYFRVQLRNEGDTASPAATVRIYRSTDATVSTADQEVASGSVAAVNPGATSTSHEITLRLPYSPGNYYYGACVDAVAGESDTTNNCWLNAFALEVRW